MPLSLDRNIIYGSLFILVCGSPAHADIEDAIAVCAGITAEDDRILCLENALRQSSSEALESDAEAAASSVSKNQNATSPPAAAATPVITEPVITDDAPVADENYGLKEPSPKEDDTLQVTVTSVSKNLKNRFLFATEGGQVWLQTDQRRALFEDTPFKAEIRPGSMGSYFLKADSSTVSVRVLREK